MEKNLVRKEKISWLKTIALSPDLKMEKEAVIYQKLFAGKMWAEAKTVGIVLSMEHELNTRPVIEQGLAAGKAIAVPKVMPERQMKFLYIDGSTKLETSAQGILEPVEAKECRKEDIDLLLVPGVAFSSLGYRIGFGGGYYDRFMEGFKGKTCSMLFREQQNDEWQPGEFDLPVECLITDE